MDRNQLCRRSRSRAFSCNYLFCLVDLLRSKCRVRRVVLRRARIGYWQRWSRVSTMIGRGETPFNGRLLRLMIRADMKYKMSRATMEILECVCYCSSLVYADELCRIYATTLRSIVPLPDSRDRSTFPPEYPPGTEVMALYPETTSFYHAKIAQSPTQTKRPTYRVVFDEVRFLLFR